MQKKLFTFCFCPIFTLKNSISLIFLNKKN